MNAFTYSVLDGNIFNVGAGVASGEDGIAVGVASSVAVGVAGNVAVGAAVVETGTGVGTASVFCGS